MSLVAMIDRKHQPSLIAAASPLPTTRISNKRKEEFKCRLRAMRMRINKKRERFVSALKNIEMGRSGGGGVVATEKSPASVLFLDEPYEAAEEQNYEDDDEDDKMSNSSCDDYICCDPTSQQQDTIRSMEVSFVIDQCGEPASVISASAGGGLRQSLVSRTSTPIFVKAGPVSSVFVAGHYDLMAAVNSSGTAAVASFRTPKSSSSRRSNKQCRRNLNNNGSNSSDWSSSRNVRQQKSSAVKFNCHNNNNNNPMMYSKPDYLNSSLSTSSYMTSMAGRFQNCGEFKVWFV